MSYQSEIAVLNIFMRNNELFEDIPIEYFTSEVHRNIYRIMLNLKDNGSDIEPNLIKLKAKQNGIDIGNEDYIDIIYMSSISPANLQEYLLDIENDYKKTKLYQLIVDARDLLNNGVNINKITDILNNEIEKLKSSLSTTEVVYLFEDTDKFVEQIIEEAKSGKLPGFSVGFSKIDAVTSGIRPGNLWIIAGRPGQGKSAFLTNSARNTNENVAIFSLEMSRPEYLEREFAIQTGIPLLNIRSRALTKSDFKKLKEAANYFKSRTDIILDTENEVISTIEKAIRKYVKEQHVKIVYIDYIQLMVDRDNNSTHELGRVSRKFKKLAKELDIGIILLSQLNRNVEMREDKRPILADLRQSGNLEEDADLVAFLYRDEYYNKDTKDKGVMEFIIRKQRNGPVGTIFLKFHKETTQITEE